MLKPQRAVYANRTGIAGVANHGDQFADAYPFSLRCQFGQQGTSNALAVDARRQIDRVFCRKTVRRAGFEPCAVGITDHLPSLFGHDVWQPF